MRWPWLWTRREVRDSGGDFSDAVVRLIEAQAAGTAADASSTAAIEAASGALSRAFSGAEVEASEGWARDAISPGVLGQVGRDLIRNGDSMHVIRIDPMGRVRLVPASSWHWEGSHVLATWTVRATAYGPSTSTTWHLPASSVIFCRWGSTPGQPYIGTGPTSFAHTTARLQSEAGRSLADEAGGPLAQIIAVPQDLGAGVDDDTDGLAGLRADIGRARGKAILAETVAAAYGEGRAAAPQRDWVAARLGPAPPEAMVNVSAAAFSRMLAATGMPPAMFDPTAPATALKEGSRQWFMGTVRPLGKLLEHELTQKFEIPVRLRFDNYPIDLAGRAMAFQKLVAGGVAVTEALVTAGLLEQE